ncbi:hypothetical protein [Aliidiomarina iranensis]|uniref:hypothetical protein n=1 Tax=Aliidiomarina iranensis TaxID=1434071 RepID=UPI000F86A52D|nr:hypothetical protein [Aliidiomarina iranensis]
MRNLITILSLAIIVGCSAKTHTPQATFSIPASKENSIEARKVLHEIAIDNNLMFEDGSHKFPSGTATTIAVAERVDGLQLILLGASEVGQITIAVHCHEDCKEWQGIHQVAKSRFAKQWVISE